ncbi:MAG TPA: SOS response-associated peptidase [Anaerolineaceae bacterium]|nr:SOS response-associated peptidase [Anaerolineaceae bacterium]
MCGRFTLTVEAADLQEDFGLSSVPNNWQPRYNIAPSQPILTVTNSHERAAEWLHWGLIPAWAKDPSISNRLINARSETLAEKPAFRSALSKRRCLILADGFYEWQHQAEKRISTQPYRFRRTDGRPFAFAGLWEIWCKPEGGEVRSCTIITCAANELVSPVHNRMPVIFDDDKAWEWLETKPIPELQSLLVPYPSQWMAAIPVSRAVNNPKLDTNECIMPVVV